MECFNAETLAAFIDGCGRENRLALRHLARCRECQAYVYEVTSNMEWMEWMENNAFFITPPDLLERMLMETAPSCYPNLQKVGEREQGTEKV